MEAAPLVVGSSTALREVLTRDLNAQKQAAEEALAQARKIDEALKKSSDTNPELKEAKEALLKVAQMLASNTAHTSSAVLEIVSSSRPAGPNES
ncbi:hypothetical protein BCCGELA001_06560 [Bradyrhizobium sp. CCGE-LA001]|nr:hypothetical protein BCCGELA001_06560 [Bradyrhizobium sp. CCGE-LA001]